MKLTKLTKAALYDVIKEEGFILPKISTTACRLSYLVNVRAGNEYCPRVDEVQGVYCENPPKRTVMLQIIYEELQRRGDQRTLTFDDKHLPDVDWCLSAISALDPLHPIFEPGYIPSNEQRGRRGRRFVPEAEELVYMIDFQSSAAKMKTNIQSSEADYDQTSYNKGFQGNKKGTLGVGKTDIQSGSGKFKNPYSNMACEKDSLSYTKTPKQEQRQLKNEFRNEKNLVSPQEKYRNQNSNNSPVISKQGGPLLNMLKKLESKGLIDECMLDYIKIQQEYEKQQSQSLNHDANQQSQKKTHQKNGDIDEQKDYLSSQSPNFQSQHGTSIKYPALTRTYTKYKLNQPVKFKDLESHLLEQDVKREDQHQENSNLNHIKDQLEKVDYVTRNQLGDSKVAEAFTMNQLMDESQVNPLEYEEVAFQDLIEENDNYGEREDESQFKGIESSSLNLHLSNLSNQQNRKQDNPMQQEQSAEDIKFGSSHMQPIIHIV